MRYTASVNCPLTQVRHMHPFSDNYSSSTSANRHETMKPNSYDDINAGQAPQFDWCLDSVSFSVVHGVKEDLFAKMPSQPLLVRFLPIPQVSGRQWLVRNSSNLLWA